ncbi:MAG: lipopolysaccharide biosynthesis protein [Muribaculaceae bacterium]|jgi:O-antigen/teichoic acid export membrane protein|nr:lipopolysaccharide biosynthesis protein [Muribaculaceae bacterium]
MKNQEEEIGLKLKTARTLKWNTIDKFSSQVLYAVTGIVLANVVSKAEFGLVGAILVFQAFASLFVDSGFSTALIQRKNPTETDYSTVFWFNLGMSVMLYAVLWLCAPWIDSIFHAEGQLIPLARVMFVTFIINATAIVQMNRLMKQMTVKMIAVSNVIGLVVSGIVGIWLALAGWGAWAIVWQSIVLATVKSAVLWLTSSWVPRMEFSIESLRSIFSVGAGVMASSFLNTIFMNIYSFIIGAHYNLVQLGNYSQADKWSKMGVMSLSQVFTASFLPILSAKQDEKREFARMLTKINRFTCYVTFFVMGLLLVSSTQIFHVFFDTKWDSAILMFQLLVVRGIFTVITSQYNNYIISCGASRKYVYSEIVKDVSTVIAIVVTIPLGVTWLVAGQVFAGIVYYFYALYLVGKVTEFSRWTLVKDSLPYVALSVVALAPSVMLSWVISNAWILLATQLVVSGGLYLLLNWLMKSKIQADALGYVFGRFIKK